MLTGQQGIKISNFGGLNTLLDATNCPVFMSPDTQDCEFFPGLVKSRPPTRNILTEGAVASSINWLKTYIMPNGDVRTLWSDNLDNFFYEDVTNAPGVLNLFFQGTLSNSISNSVTQFGREYVAMGNGQSGLDLPRQYNGNDNSFNRISQDGPGAPPNAVEDSAIWALSGPAPASQLAGGVAITSISQVGSLVTVTAASGFGFGKQNESVVVAGVTPSGYNGTFPVTWIAGALGQSFTYNLATTGLAAGTGGTVSSQAAKFAIELPNGGFSSASPTAIQQALALGPFYFPIGTSITVSGSSVGGYNGTWQVIGYTTWFTTSGGFNHYRLALIVNIASTSLATGTGGQLVAVGNIDPGVHQVSVMFLTNSGYLTRPAPVASWTASGGKRVFISNIPIGPSNVVARYLIFTPISSDQFFFIATTGVNPNSGITPTVINDNTTTAAYFNFADTDLLDGTSADDFFDLITLPPINGITEYSSRFVSVGARNLIQNFVNLSFDGGFTVGTGAYPLGWSPDALLYAGGDKTNTSVFGDALAITGTGSGFTFGKLTQSAFQDYLGNPILTGGTQYTISAYFRKNNSMIGVTATIQLISASAGYTDGLSVAVGSQVNTSAFTQLTANLSALPNPLPSDLVLQIQSQNNGTGETVIIDEIEIWPTQNPVLTSAALVSNVEDAESYNGLTGLLQPTEENGQALTSAFVIRDFLYLVKQRSLFVTQDDGQNEPNQWSINEVSQKVGSPSFRGVGIGDEWAVIASESGLWFFTGGILSDSNKLSTEIQPTWDQINWDFGYLIDVKVDTKRKRVYISAPFGSNSNINNKVLTLDYTEGWADATTNNGVGRKWCPWALGVSAQNLLLRQDGTVQMAFGGNNGNDNIFVLDSTLTTNNPLDAHWESGFFQDDVRLNFGYVTANVTGSGTLQMTLRRGDQSWFKPIRGWFLNTLGFNNAERQIQQQGYRMAIRFGTAATTDYFSLQNLTMYVKQADWAPVRGINA